MKTMKTLGLTFAFAAVALLATSCGTVRGFGQDVERAGRAIERNAR